MRVRLDAHVHLYSCFDAAVLRSHLMGWLARSGGNACGMILAERQGETLFRDALKRGWLVEGISVEPVSWDENALAIRFDLPQTTMPNRDAPAMLVFAGRQIAVRERIEIGCIGASPLLPDGMSVDETVHAVLQSGGVPSLPWGLGKWLGARGQCVAKLVERYASDGLVVVDSSMRFRGWPRPAAFRLAVNARCPVLAGSDPMPYAADAGSIGTYGALLDLHEEPLCRRLRKSGERHSPSCATFGRRAALVTVLMRFLKARRAVRAFRRAAALH